MQQHMFHVKQAEQDIPICLTKVNWNPAALEKKKPRVLAKTASVVLVSADAVKACARRALHVKQAWSGSCAARTTRSVIAFKMEVRCS